MKIFVHAKPGSKQESIQKSDATHFVVRVREQPEKGRANEAVVRTVARYLGVPAGRVKIVAGRRSRRKILSLDK